MLWRGYNKVVKRRLWLAVWVGVCFALAASAQDRDGNFGIRFEPTAKLQTGAPVPFSIVVKDGRKKPLAHAKVTLQIEDQNGSSVRVFPAIEVEAGTYVAKPSFDASGQWVVYVEVLREGLKSARTIQFQVSD